MKNITEIEIEEQDMNLWMKTKTKGKLLKNDKAGKNNGKADCHRTIFTELDIR